MKSAICAACGAVGTFIAAALGGWDTAIITLLSLMLIDYISGWVCAAVFQKSHKTSSGGYSSSIGLKGLCKKVMILALVIVANLLDKQIGANYIRDGVCICFMANEAMSIIENAGLMGVPIPVWLTKALDILDDKNQEKSA